MPRPRLRAPAPESLPPRAQPQPLDLPSCAVVPTLLLPPPDPPALLPPLPPSA